MEREKAKADAVEKSQRDVEVAKKREVEEKERQAAAEKARKEREEREAAAKAKAKRDADEAAAQAMLKPVTADLTRGAIVEAEKQLRKIVKEYPDTKAAVRAKELLKQMGKE
jgi:hypothetical protein